MDLGNPQAKVTVVEYASVGCPVCAKWQKEVYPAFKAKYVDTGKVHYVFREMLVGGGPEIAVAASGFLLARCAGKDKYFAVNDAIFKNQEQAFQAPRETLVDIAKSVGMTEDSFNKCINDEKAHQGAERPRRAPQPRRPRQLHADLRDQRQGHGARLSHARRDRRGDQGGRRLSDALLRSAAGPRTEAPVSLPP